MITIYKTRLIIKNKSDDLISQLIWKTKLVDSILFAKTSSIESNTIRPFVGQLDEKNEVLVVKRVRPLLLNSYFPQVTAEIESRKFGFDNYLTLNFKLGIYTTICFVVILFALFILLVKIIEETNIEEIIDYLIVIILIISAIYIMTLFEIKKTIKTIKGIIILE